jgi:hypothetical protein
MFVMETGCVLVEVWTGFLNIIYIIFGFKGLRTADRFVESNRSAFFRIPLTDLNCLNCCVIAVSVNEYPLKMILPRSER